MSSSQSKMTSLVIATVLGIALGMPRLSSAQSELTVTNDQTPRVSIAYVPPSNPAFQTQYDPLQERRALEKIQEILSPFLWPEELTIKTRECGVVNSWYRRENLKPTVTICYEFLQHTLESLPNETTPDGITGADAAVGQFLWLALHEVGHAAFDMFDVPIFGNVEDAADNFATYIILQFGKNQARRLIVGAAWAWRAYLGDYKRNPVVPLRLAAFASDHGLPQERYYNLLCLAVGAQHEVFADLEAYLPATRSRHCVFEYQRLVHAFGKAVAPHIDRERARQVLDTNWLESLQSKPASSK
jgi:Putative metallopeptidase